MFSLGVRRKSERHLDPASEKGFRPYRFSVFFYSGGIFWGVLPGRLSRRAGDGKNWLQKRNSCRLVLVRRGRRAFSAGVFFACFRFLPFCAVFDGLPA